MANYQILKANIDEKIYENAKQKITGENLNSVLNAMVATLGAEYQFAGVATIDTNPEASDAKVFYIANGKGTYTNFGGINVTEDDIVILYYDTSWHKVATGIASNNKLTELESGQFAYMFTSDSMILGKFITSDGIIVDYSTSNLSEYIPVVAGQKLKLIKPFIDDASVCVVYKFNHEISRFLSASAKDSDGNLPIEIQEGEYFIRASWFDENIPARIEISGTIANYAQIQAEHYTNSGINEVNASVFGGQVPVVFSVGNAGHYVSYNGTVEKNSNYAISTAISLKEGDTIKANINTAGDAVAAISELIQGTYKPLVIGDNQSQKEYTYTANRDMNVVLSSFYFRDGITIGDITIVKAGLVADIDAKIASVNLITTTRVTDSTTKNKGAFVNASTMVLTTHSDYFYTDLIELQKGQTIVVEGADPSGDVVGKISRWSADGNTCLEILARGTTEFTTSSHRATENIEYIRVSNYWPNKDNTLIYIDTDEVSSKLTNAINEIIPVQDNLLPSIAMFERVACCGDSYVSGAIYVGETFIGEKTNLSWGKCLERLHGGINVSVFASGGADTNTWQTRNTCLPAALAADPCDLYIFCLGINDFSYVTKGSMEDITGHQSYADYPNTYYGNYGKIIEQIIAHAPNARIILMTPFYQKTSGYYSYAKDALVEISSHYNIAFIDTADSKLANSSFFMSGLVGGHPTAPLYSAMAKDINRLVDNVMRTNYDYFKGYVGRS